ncbi:polyphosphate kinase 1 [bacterium]|nr:polyphosphate kinase 1 [bacterium]
MAVIAASVNWMSGQEKRLRTLAAQPQPRKRQGFVSIPRSVKERERMRIALIWAMSENRVIGRDNQLPWYLPNDLQYFKRVTSGKPVIMGRKTYDSIGKPLPNRTNIIITRDPNYQAEGCQVVHSLDDAISLAQAQVAAGGGDEEETGDLRRAIEGELVYRQYGDEVRLEVAANCPDELVQFLFKQFEISEVDLYRANGPVNLNRLAALIDFAARPELLYPPFDARVPRLLRRKANIFEAIRKSDILLHHPFDSFIPVVELIRQAAKDPDVLTIKQTLYRTGAKSIIVDELVAAAKAGKEVTVIIELLARFDEEANVALAERLQEYGIHVVYGIVGYKTHAKMLMVARREGDKLRHYVHLGTGNYHPKTAQVYTDYGLMTCNKQIGDDVYRVFLQLTSLGKVSKLDMLFQSPFTLHKTMMRRIEREIENAQAGKTARIILKMNSLYEEQLANKLYEASQAGVQVDLIVRGVCQIRPGIKDLSENIRVRSIVGRFLEHTRAYCFHNDGDPEVILASADWMSRNMFHRVEIGFPLLMKKLRDKVIKDLELYLADNSQAWELDAEGHYRQCQPGKAEPISAQEALLAEALSGTGSL